MVDHSINSNLESRITEIITIISSIFILLALGIIMRTPSATGYELSIYNQYPYYFWVLLIAALFFGNCLLIHQSFIVEKSRWWIFGLYIIIFINLILILLPIFRGYLISDAGDEMSHLGFIKTISLTGYVGKTNVYPLAHILSFELLSIARMNSNQIIKIIPAFFYLIYMLGIYSLSNTICDNIGQKLLIIAFSSVLLFTYFNYLFLPTQLFLYLVPSVLFLFFKRTYSINSNYNITFIIMISSLPFLHPLGSFFLIILLLIYSLLNLISNILNQRSNIKIIDCVKCYNLNHILIISIVFIMWFANFALFNSTVDQAYNWFINGYGTPPIVELQKTVESNLTFMDFVILFIKTYGHNIIFASIAFGAIFLIIRKGLIIHSPLSLKEIFFPATFLFFTIFYISTLIGAFIKTGNSQRVFCWALMASIVTNGMICYDWISKFNKKNFIICTTLLTILIMVSIVIGIFSVYPSPYTLKPNIQVSLVDWTGIEWFIDNKSNDDTICFDQIPWRAPHTMYGIGLYDIKKVGRFYTVPPHIGYDKYKSIGAEINSNTYIVITEFIRACKEQLWQTKGTYTLDELNRINCDFGANKIYSNRDLSIFYAYRSENKNKARENDKDLIG